MGRRQQECKEVAIREEDVLPSTTPLFARLLDTLGALCQPKACFRTFRLHNMADKRLLITGILASLGSASTRD